jgi:hypothetical protein
MPTKFFAMRHTPPQNSLAETLINALCIICFSYTTFSCVLAILITRLPLFTITNAFIPCATTTAPYSISGAPRKFEEAVGYATYSKISGH